MNPQEARVRQERPPQSSPWAKHWDLDPTVHFLNHGSFGACPRVVREEQRRWQDRLEHQPVQFLARDIEPLLDEVRYALGTFLGTHGDNLALIPNATTGVNTVLRGLRFEKGDQLLVTDQEYNASRNALDMVARQWGSEVVVAKVPFPISSPKDVVECVLHSVTERTKLLLIDAITSPTGTIMPVPEIAAKLASHPLDILVDAAHAPGMIPVNLDELNVSYWTGNAHKWLCTPKGSAVLYVRPDRQENLHPLAVSHGLNSNRSDRSRFRLEHDWTGTCDPSAWLSVPSAITFLSELMPGGFDELRSHNRNLILEGRRTIASVIEAIANKRGDEARPYLPCPDECIGSLGTVLLARDECQKADGPTVRSAAPEDPLQTVLREKHSIELPVSRWPSLNRRMLRISAQAYNERSQYERLADALHAESEWV